MPLRLAWLAAVIRLAITPVFIGALVFWLVPQPSGRDLAAGTGLALLGAVHLWYWSRAWLAPPRVAAATVATMVLINLALLQGLALAQPLLWLYPALVAGAGLRPPLAAGGVGLMALAAVLPNGLEATRQLHDVGLGHPALWVVALGPAHVILLAVALAGLGMVAVRQLILVNADLHATKAELATLAVSAERERMARELHDLLGRTLSLIAVKAELAGRLSAAGDPSARAEMGDVQQFAREAIRQVREAVMGSYVPSLAAELAAGLAVLRMAGIAAQVEGIESQVDSAHEATIAWVLREAVTNVVRHSEARTCHISLQTSRGVTALEVVDDGRGSMDVFAGGGLAGIARRMEALGGSFEAGPKAAGGFRVRVQLGVSVASRASAEVVL